MPIPVTCSHCHTTFRVKDRYEGAKGACPECGGAIHVPLRPVPTDEEESDMHVLSVNALARVEMKPCPQCGKPNPVEATECFFCSAPT